MCILVFVSLPLDVLRAGWSMIVVLIDFSLTVKATTLIFIFGRGSAILSAKQGKSGSIKNK